MRKLLLALLLVPAGASADFIRYYPPAGGGGGGAWGTITGTLSAQTDLQTALNAKCSLAGCTMTAPILGAGTACSAPAFSFPGDTNAGMCIAAANDVQFQSGPGVASSSLVRVANTQAQIAYYDAAVNLTRFSVGDNSFTFQFEGANIATVPNVNGNLSMEPASTGLYALTAAGAAPAARTITAGTGISVANGAGTAGNPIISADAAVLNFFTTGTGSPPATCTAGKDVYAETDQLRACICSATDTWTCNGKLRAHATDCTALTDGIADEMCFERDANTLYVCEPSAGGCDTAGEWTAIGGGSGAPSDAKYIVAESNGTLSAEVAPSAADQVPVSDSTSATTWRTLPNGLVSYDTSTNTFSVGSQLGFLYTAMNDDSEAVPGSSTGYYGVGKATYSATAGPRAVFVPAACSVRDLYVKTTSTQHSSGSLVFHIYNATGAAATAVTVTFNASQGQTTLSDTGNSTAMNAGDLVVLRAVNNATSSSAEIRTWGFRCN